MGKEWPLCGKDGLVRCRAVGMGSALLGAVGMGSALLCSAGVVLLGSVGSAGWLDSVRLGSARSVRRSLPADPDSAERLRRPSQLWLRGGPAPAAIRLVTDCDWHQESPMRLAGGRGRAALGPGARSPWGGPS